MTVRKRRWVCASLVVASLALLSACATPTPYQPFAYSGGYTDRRIAPDLYAVDFRGNGKTSADLVMNMYLYRCAELTRQNGFEVFQSRKPESPSSLDGDKGIASAADADDTSVVNFASHAGYVPIYVPGQTVTINRYSASGLVRMGRYDDVPADIKVWDARLVIETLERVVRTPRGESLSFQELAKVAMVSGRGPATGGEPRTTLDDLNGLLPGK